jgi:cytochrome c
LKRTKAYLLGACLSSATAAVSAQASVDEDAAEALARKSGCTKCHSVSARKDGPSFRETAAKYRGRADSEQSLYIHVTTGPVVELDGVEERHAIVKTKDEAAIRNLIQYILSR